MKAARHSVDERGNDVLTDESLVLQPVLVTLNFLHLTGACYRYWSIARRDSVLSRTAEPCGDYRNTSGTIRIRGRSTTHLKCFFENARPEPVFRYCSNSAALAGSANVVYATSLHGRRGAVCWEPPLLWTASRRSTLSVMPV